MTILLLLSFILFPSLKRAQAEDIFSQEIQDITTRYSYYLDSQWVASEANGVKSPVEILSGASRVGNGWNYSVPSSHYREVEKNSSGNLRMQATFAAAYAGRDDDESKVKVRAVLRNALIELPKQQANVIILNEKEVSTRSFHDAIGLYLALQVIQKHSDWFSWGERFEMIHNAKQMFPWALKASDTENRAFLGAAYGEAILKHPLISFNDQEKKEYGDLIRRKVQEGLKSVGRDVVYREGTPKRFSIHYHLVSANMLFYLCEQLPDRKYCNTAERMTGVVRNWFPAGKLSSRGSSRPRGIGLQTVLLRAFAEKFSGSPKWQEFWHQEQHDRGFIDTLHPDRLVWKDEIDKTLNDDYSFINMAELLVRDD